MIRQKQIHLLRAEWICIFFLMFAGIRLLASPHSLNWNGIRWSAFPRLDILFIALTVWVLKLSRQKRFIGILVLIQLVLTFFSLIGQSSDFFLPTNKLLNNQFLEIIKQLRYPLLATFFLSLLFLSYKNPIWKEEGLIKTRLIIPLFMMVFMYSFVPLIINPGNPLGSPDLDFLFSKMDTALFLGNNPTLSMEKWISPLLSEWMAFSYSIYGPFFALVFGCLYLRKENTPIEEMIFMTTCTLAIGYASYTFFPVKGPMFMQTFNIPLDLYYMKDFKALYMDRPRIDRDCFPSLHTAVSLVLLYQAKKNLKPLFWTFLPIVICIPMACVYLRYHYVVDVLAGIGLTFFVIFFTKWMNHKSSF